MSKQKILVVDADEEIRTMLDSYFTGRGFDVITWNTVSNSLSEIVKPTFRGYNYKD